MSDPQRPHGLQPTRLLHPWDFPGTSTGVGCHCLLRLVAQLCPTLCNPMDWGLPGFSVPEILQARILEWGSHSLLQGIFPTQGSNPGLPHCRQTLLILSDTLIFTSSGYEIICNYSLNWEKAMAPHSSTLAWKIPWMEEPGRLQSMGSLRVRHD